MKLISFIRYWRGHLVYEITWD